MRRVVLSSFSILVRLTVVLVLLLGTLLPLLLPARVTAAPVQHPAQEVDASRTLRLSVVSARTEADAPGGPVLAGDPVAQYKYLINVDNTGDPDQARNPNCSSTNPNYPDSCDWPSIRAVPGAAPIFTQGTEADFANGGGITLPPGKYLISVMADGYKLDGKHFTVPLPGNGGLEVALQPHPLPSATMRIKVFEDVSPVNGQFDAPAEQGLAGFRVTINDIAGEISADVFGNPLCTTYNAAGNPNGRTNCLVSDSNGDIVVPNLGTNRFDVVVVPPDGTDWVETTTLEGSPSWDTWLAEGATGLDNEFVVAGEPFPWTVFGFVRPRNNLPNNAGGGVKGRLVSASVYLPQTGGLAYYGDIWNGFNGAKVTGPINDGWVALSDLQNGDTAVYIGKANPNGTYQINNVPDGNYQFTWWDERLHHILDWIQVTVSNGQIYDMGTPFLTGWFTKVDGYVFNDLNKNGRKDAGENGLANYLVVLRDRDNSEIDRMSIAVTTDQNGYYVFEKAYPMNSWMILEAYNDRFYTTGVTYQVENQPSPTTVLGNGVDVGLLPVLGQSGRLDWGVHAYETGTNGGIVGTVFYDTTRNELDPRYAAVEGWAPGIPNLPVNLYSLVFCGTNPGVPCDERGDYELAPDGSYAKGQLLNTTTTEVWEQPIDCTARDANGNVLRNPQDQQLLPTVNPASKRCLEAPLMGTQFQRDFATLDGNYGFADGCFGAGGFNVNNNRCADGSDPTPLPADDYLVEVVIPQDSLGRPLYQVEREEDINVFGGDQFIPAVPPPACAGALHTVDVADDGVDGYPADTTSIPGVTIAASTPVANPSFIDAGGSPYEGAVMPLCDKKLVTLDNGKSIAPLFTLFTEVPIPGKWKGYIIDDLSISTDPQSLNYGEKAGIPNAPIGIYDFTNRLLTTIHSDPNGVYEVLLPSTYSMNCPTPSGVCPSMYYILGNDPGQPGALNANYNPQYRTIGATFEVYPGVMLPSDLAPTQIVPGVLAAGSLYGIPPQCSLDDNTPQIFALSQPYHNLANGQGIITIDGQGFGQQQGNVTMDGAHVSVNTWSNTRIRIEVSNDQTPGPHQLQITATNGNHSVNGITFHVIGNGYNPRIFEVGPGKAYATIQSAVDAASATDLSRPRLVVVYPGATAQWNPSGAYFENVLINSPITLQGVGPGGRVGNGREVLGSVIDGRGVAGDTDYATAWRDSVLALNWDGNQAIYEGPVIYVLARNNQFRADRYPRIDGLTITGGDQQGFPNNLQPGDPTIKEFTAVQGGAIFVNGYGTDLQITNNVVESNGGAYGAIRLGTPHLTGQFTDNRNDNIRIANNRILANGGTNLAGAIAIFNGADNYDVAYNDICGNFSAEYGGGISHYGYSANGAIHHNRVYFNRAYDEGGGVIIAGELPANPNQLSPGAGPVNVYANLIQNNLSNDDGGGLRFLMAGNFPYNVYNNIIANNISTHEGGGVSLNDAPDVRFYNNTVMKNITTATAVTSLGQPAPAGLSTAANSDLLQRTLSGSAPSFSDPLLFNNIFWDNRAGNFTGSTVAGIGLTGDPNTIRYWDLGVADGTGQLAPTYSVLQTTYGTVEDNSNLVNSDPSVVTEYNTTVSIQPWRGNPRFVDVVMVTVDATPNALGDYRITASSSARDSGSNGQAGINAPADDIEGNARPDGTAFDIGADEYSNGGGSNGGGNNGGGNNGGVIPFTTALDTFNQRNGALAPAWGGDINVNQFRVVRRSLAQSRAVDGGTIWWAAQNFDANQDAFMTLNIIKRSTRRTTKYQGLLLKFKGDTITSPEASMIVVRYATTTGVEILTQAPGQPLVLQGVLADVTFQNGDQLGARALADGSVLVFKNGTAVGGVNVASGPNPWPYSAQGGRIGVTYNYRAGRFDNFGGNNYEGAAAASVSSLVIDTALGLPAPVVEPESVTGEIEELEEEFELFMPIVSN